MSEIGNKNLEKPLRVGITGGIGSGKTTVCSIFEELGVPVYYADARAKAIMTDNSEVVQKVTELFGPGAYLEDGSLNRSFIAGVVFQDKAMLEMLNSVVHPAVLEDGKLWNRQHDHVPYTLKEAALLYESGSFKFLDKIIVVHAPLELRVKRVMERDGVGEEAVLARIKNQMPDEEKLRRADFVIHNDGSTPLVQQVWEIHRHLTAIAAAKKS